MPQKPDVLIVEDDADWLEIYSSNLASEEYNITSARTVKRASKLLSQQKFIVVATDLRLLGAHTGGFDILEIVREQSPDTQVIIFTGVGGKQDAFEAMRRGAFDYVTKPLDYEHVRRVIKSAIEVREQKLSYQSSSSRARKVDLPFPEKFVGSSEVIKRVLSQVADIIESSKPILIWGAPGTGKALITETIHLASKRKRFVLVNCGSFSETTMERTLFGFQKDAFPGAVEDEPGLLEQSTGGTLVLDKVSDLSPRLQNRLFSALNHRRTRRLGGAQELDVDIRVIATLQESPTTYLDQGLISRDLHDYLTGSIIELPVLKERKDNQTDDVLLLTGYFLDKYSSVDKPPPTISEEASDLLQVYDFPGNVRELEQAIRRAVMMAESSVIEPHHLPEHIQIWQRSEKLANVTRDPLPEQIYCPHGYALTDQPDTIAHAFDTENYVFLSTGDNFISTYRSTVIDVLNQCGLKLFDTPQFPSDEVHCEVCQPILSSHLAIFDISTTNPRIFYELGLAQAIGVPCAILKEENSQVSEKMGDMDLLEYDNDVSLKKALLDWLNHLASSS